MKKSEKQSSEKPAEQDPNKPSDVVVRFFSDVDRMVRLVAINMKSAKTDEPFIGSRVFALMAKGEAPPFPVMNFSLDVAKNSDERRSIIAFHAHELAKDTEHRVLAFVVVAEAWMSAGKVDSNGEALVMPSKDPARKEVVIISARDDRNNYRFEMKDIHRTPEGVMLKPAAMLPNEAGWQKKKKGEDGFHAEDALLDTAWREYTIAKLLAGVHIPG